MTRTSIKAYQSSKSNSETQIQEAQHAFLVVWGWFAEHIGLIQKLQALSLKQKHSHHRPQTKVLEFQVAILAGLQKGY